MKKIKLIFVSLFAVAMMLSCDDDGGDSKLNLDAGAVPDITKSETNDAILDLLKIQDGEDITIGFSIEMAQGKVSSLDIVSFYMKANGTAEKAVLATNVTTFPTSMTLTKQQLIDKFTILTGDADFELGDQLIVSADLTLENGTVVKLRNDNGSQNYGQDIANSPIYSVTQFYPVACPSDLAGTYSVVSSGESTDSGPSPDINPIANYPFTVTLTDAGGGSYAMSDAYGGLYLLWYAMYGITPDHSKATIKDVCGTLSASYTGPFSEAVTLEGTVNDDGTLTIHWENEFGDFGDSVYTKN